MFLYTKWLKITGFSTSKLMRWKCVHVDFKKSEILFLFLFLKYLAILFNVYQKEKLMCNEPVFTKNSSSVITSPGAVHGQNTDCKM